MLLIVDVVNGKNSVPESQQLLEEARSLDTQDELRAFRDEFYVPEKTYYMDGNSLGLLSRPAEQRLLQTLDEWKRLGIEGWLQGDPPWYYLADELAALLAPMLGAAPDEVVIANSTSVNLHQILATFYQPEGQRSKIIIDEYAFPTDVYAIQSQMRLRGLDPQDNIIVVKAVNVNNERLIEEDEIIARIDDHAHEVAMLILPGVIYTTGQLFDMQRLTAAAHQHDIPICIDASHSVGSVPHQFNDWGVDYAIWCNYKYLNAGPGAVGGLYVNRKHFGATPGLAGWFSSDKSSQFDMAHQPTFAQDASAYQIGTPPLLSMAPLQATLEMFQAAGIERVRAKSLKQTRYLMTLIESELDGLGFSIPTPDDDARRGGHVALAHPEAASINKALKERGVIPDFRPPDIIRLAPIALYTSYEEIAETMLIIKRIVQQGEHRALPNVRDLIA